MSITLLTNAGTTGAGPAKQLINGEVFHTIEVIIGPTGTVTALTVALNGSVTGSQFSAGFSHVFTAGELAAKFAQIVFGQPWAIDYIQAEITNLTGTNPLVTVNYSGRGGSQL